MPSNATLVFEKLERDVDALLTLHSGSGSPGRPKGNNAPLLRSALVVLVTAWENYVEQVVGEAVEQVVPAVSADPSLLSPFLRAAVASKAERSVWAVIGDGWLDVAGKRVRHEIETFNNAASRQVNDLVTKALGIENVLDAVAWRQYDAGSAQAELTSLVNEVRGEIVHRGTTPGSLDLDGVRSWRSFVNNLVARFDAALAEAVAERYGFRPW
ncbi:HEPN domain-containing protein [Micromonospora maritima]|uniref:HEPN domain-containing protein n=1 Tax=Micromonospora maritima TaxID=986711 RepID=UPI00157D01AC|nr:HEPN domain-containing protein [Micromonospora maritima]